MNYNIYLAAPANARDVRGRVKSRMMKKNSTTRGMMVGTKVRIPMTKMVKDIQPLGRLL